MAALPLVIMASRLWGIGGLRVDVLTIAGLWDVDVDVLTIGVAQRGWRQCRRSQVATCGIAAGRYYRWQGSCTNVFFHRSHLCSGVYTGYIQVWHREPLAMSGNDSASDDDDGPTFSLFGSSTAALAATAQQHFLALKR